MSGPVVVITGCSLGSLGAALAEEFAKRGCTVYATARNPAKLVGLSPGIHQFVLDASKDESVSHGIHRIVETEGRIDILVNSAGGARIGALLEVPLEDVEKLFQANVMTTLRVIKAVAPHMIKRKSGLIINLGSLAGRAATPWFGTYCTTKAAVHMLTDTLDMELRPFNIKVMLLALGMIRSTIVENTAAKHAPITESYYDAYRKNIEARLGQGDDVMSPDVFARKTVDAALAPSPPSYMAFGGQAGFFTWLYSVLPRSWQLSLGWHLYSGKTPKA